MGSSKANRQKNKAMYIFFILNLFLPSIPLNKKLEHKHNWPASSEQGKTSKLFS